MVFNNITKKIEFHEDYVDLILEQEFFDNLEITIGPNVSEAEKQIVESLIKSLGNNSIQINSSKIKFR